jgi:hypothetical protein
MPRGRSRYNKFSIMSNSGFGDLVVKRNGITMVIPQSLITQDGSVYKRIQSLMDKNDYINLEKNGIKIKRGCLN